jgi:dipeptidyl aminopeptidase/acylaminoacyl peptidase
MLNSPAHARRGPWILALALAAGPPSGCNTPHADFADGPHTPAAPSLEQIFRIPGIHGRPPRPHSISADGDWALFRWNPLEVGEQGELRTERQGSLRLVSTTEPARTEYRGARLIDLLPPRPPRKAAGPASKPESNPDQEQVAKRPEPRLPKPIAAWSERGALLAVARADQVFLLTPDLEVAQGWRAALLYEDPPVAATPEENADDGAAAPVPDRVGSVTRLNFVDDDQRLLIANAEQAWILPLDGPAPVALGGAEHLTSGIEASNERFQLSQDRTILFRHDPPLAWLEGAPEPTARTPAQVFDRRQNKPIALAGMADMDGIERSSLSPDGRWILAENVDKSGEPAPNLVPDYLTARASTREARNDRADDAPLPRELWMWDCATGTRVPVSLPELGGSWLRHIGWAPQPRPDSPARYAIARLSADFRKLEIWCWDEGLLVLLHTERDERWVGGPSGRPRWAADGRAILFGSESCQPSDTPGRNQLYAADPKTMTVRQLTRVRGEVDAFVPLEGGGCVFTYSEADAPGRRRIGWLPADSVRSAGPMVELQAPVGFNSGLMASRDGKRLILEHGRLGVPDELWLTEIRARGRARALTRTVPEAFTAVDWIRPVPFQVRNAGATVRSHVYMPPGTSLVEPGRKRPAIVFIHGAGYLQNVTDSMTQYEVNFMFHSRLARMGYVVIDVDYRGSRGYGRDFRTDVQYRLGGLDLDDIHRTVDALAARGVIDRERVGCYGGSYGGFLTLMALFTAPERWTCGAALRSVTDWRSYNASYTQPRLGRPSTHPEAYEQSSPIDHAQNLRDPLLILHGLVDSNVFVQDSIRLIEKLIDLGLDFEAMLYPSQGHAFSDGAHWLDEYRRIERFLIEHLGPA